jgi:hypothetical protein
LIAPHVIDYSLQFVFKSIALLWLPLTLALAALAILPRSADARPDSESPAVQQTCDVGDLWRTVRHENRTSENAIPSTARKTFIVAAPVVASKPSTGLTAGLFGEMAFVAGDPTITHLSSVIGGAKVSARGQVISSLQTGIFTSRDRWFIRGDARISRLSLASHNLGTLDGISDAATLNYNWFNLAGTAYRQVGRRVFVGAGLTWSDHADVRAHDLTPGGRSEYVEYSRKHGLPADRQVSGGANVSVLLDSRDNAVNAAQGFMVDANYRAFFPGVFGGNSTWREFTFDARTYRPLTADARQRLAVWLMGDFVTSGAAPFLDLPATGSDGRSARGYSEGRYRGPRLMYGEMEYRASLVRSGLLGAVAFLNTTTIGGESPSDKLFHSYASGAGAGFRVLLDKRSRTNFCADYGWGKRGSRGLYLAVQEAF